jgi:hypothetical protein
MVGGRDSNSAGAFARAAAVVGVHRQADADELRPSSSPRATGSALVRRTGVWTMLRMNHSGRQ